MAMIFKILLYKRNEHAIFASRNKFQKAQWASYCASACSRANLVAHHLQEAMATTVHQFNNITLGGRISSVCNINLVFITKNRGYIKKRGEIEVYQPLFADERNPQGEQFHVLLAYWSWKSHFSITYWFGTCLLDTHLWQSLSTKVAA